MPFILGNDVFSWLRVAVFICFYNVCIRKFATSYMHKRQHCAEKELSYSAATL
jgi:hypothetical protein